MSDSKSSSRHLVVSAVNFSEGGPLTVLVDALDAAAATLGPEWRITALVHDTELISNPRVETIAFPESKRSWLTRLKLEWSVFGKMSRRWRPDLWVSLHDITPRVVARRQAVYCHNSSPFYRPSLTEARFDPRFFLFNKLYMRLYGLFIRRNHAVVVQQGWLRDAFRAATGHPNIVVAYPGTAAENALSAPGAVPLRAPVPGAPLRLIYPALPRVFKNVEVLCEAARLLTADQVPLVDIRLTLDGTENAWAAELVRRYDGMPGISFIGRQDRHAMTAEYAAADVVVFPSRLETWGLPITEAKQHAKPLLVADLPYAHETLGDYDRATFVPADDARAWADAIVSMIEGRWTPQLHRAVVPAEPFASNWPALWSYLIEGL